jgi:STE24 endopeptidase
LIFRTCMVSEEIAISLVTPPRSPDTAKRYNRTKLLLGIVSMFVSFALVLGLVAGGITRWFEARAFELSTNPYVALLSLAAMVGLVRLLVLLPLRYYSGFTVEHRYHLSNQTFTRWLLENVKGVLVGLPIVAGLLVFLYYCLNTFGTDWWLPVAIGVTFVSVVLARIGPVIIMPLFYKFTPLPDGTLKDRIEQLCREAGVKFRGVFSFNMSKNTRKANAGFTGIGKSKRIILGDTLLNGFTEEEVETVFAHELGHYVRRHIVIGIVLGTVSTFAGLYVTAQLYAWLLPVFGFSSLTDLAAVPLLGLCLAVYGLVTSPLGAMISRKHERDADAYAVRMTGNKTAFISALRTLEAMNLADPDPHPVVEFLFYSHPAIGKRVRAVETLVLQ